MIRPTSVEYYGKRWGITAWNVVDIDVGGNGGDGVGKNMWHLIGDVMATGRELWA